MKPNKNTLKALLIVYLILVLILNVASIVIFTLTIIYNNSLTGTAFSEAFLLFSNILATFNMFIGYYFGKKSV